MVGLWYKATVKQAIPALGSGFAVGQPCFFRVESPTVYHIYGGYGWTARKLSRQDVGDALTAERDDKKQAIPATEQERLSLFWTIAMEMVHV